MKRFSNFRNTVLGGDDHLLKKAWDTLCNQGIFVVVKKTAIRIWTIIWRFFREYVPLKFLYLFFTDGKIMKKVQGNKMFLDMNDLGISRELALYGVHEYNSTEEVKRIITPGMKILEIGANIGYYALIEATRAGNSGQLYAIEPSPTNFEALKKNLELNGIRNAYLHQAAFGEKRGKATFYVYDRSNLSSFIKRTDMGMACTEVEVEILTLDDFLQGKEVDFVRMDVEGYEREILRGAEQAFASGKKPKYFFIEVHSDLLHKKGSSCKEILELLGGYGYDIKKSFWRGKDSVSVSSMEALMNHPKREIGYWETFFELK